MTEQQHRATDSEWYCIKAHGCGSKTEIPATYSTIHELLCRVEALEAAQHTHVDLSHLSDVEREKMLKSIANPGRFEALEAAATRAAAHARAKSNHRENPDSSLMVRVAEAMQPGTFDWSAYEGEARAAIREVAAWLREGINRRMAYGLYWAQRLEQEAER